MLIGVIGQSNAGLELSAEWEPSGNLKIWRGGCFSPACKTTHSLGHLIGDRVAREMPKQTVRIAIAAHGGITIRQWDNPASPPDMWRTTCETMAAASCEAGEKVSAIFWFQGEADVTAGNQHYTDDFHRLYARLDDQQWLAPDAAFFIFGLSQVSLNRATSFNENLAELESELLRRFFIDTSAIPVEGWEEEWDVPFLHLNADGQKMAADLAFERWRHAQNIPAEKDKWKAEAARLAGKVGPLMDQRQALMIHAMHLQSIIDRMHASTSWRLTAPLRWLRRGMEI